MTANLEVVRIVFDEFNETLELPARLFRDDVEWYPPAGDPDNDPRHGLERVADYVNGWSGTFDDYHVTVEEMFERGGAVVVVIVLHGRFAGGSAELHQLLAQVWTVDGGRIAEVHEFRTRDEALAALQV